ncbi:MAG: triose-phosphate isomerase [Bacillota bacterium]
MKLIIAANWKMHKTAAETVAFCHDFCRNLERYKGIDILLCPPFTALDAAADALSGTTVKLGAQNIYWENEGAFTGEISAPMLLEHRVEFVIIGHSERRHLMGETDSQVHKKMRSALNSGLRPILCVGETEEERKQQATASVLERQLRGALEGLDPAETESLVIAYEPVWAIGSGQAASADDAEEAALLIREMVKKLLGERSAAGLRIQYGGSVKDSNIGLFVRMPSIDGALVGGASLQAESFRALISAAGDSLAEGK